MRTCLIVMWGTLTLLLIACDKGGIPAKMPPKALLLYVLPAGEGDDKLAKPSARDRTFSSLVAARDHIRQWRASGGTGPVEVHVASGTYPLPATFDLGSIDSGRAGAPITYVADGLVRLVGGTYLKLPTQWVEGEELVLPYPDIAPPSDEPRDRRLGRDRPDFDLYWAGQRLPLASWPDAVERNGPNEGWAYIGSVSPAGNNDRFICRELPAWLAQVPPGTEIRIFSQPNWFDECIAVKSYDPETGEVCLMRPAAYALTSGARLRVQNAQAALNAAGEWWFDAGNKEIHVLAPRAGTTAPGIMISRLPLLLNMHGVSHVVISGLTWEGATRDAVRLSNVTDCRFINNRIGLTGGWGLIAQTNGRLQLAGNMVYDTGLGGMKLIGGDRRHLQVAQITATDNTLTHMGQLLACYMPAFSIDGVGIVLANNRISHLPHTAVVFTGNNHHISNNLIEDVCNETNDVGAIYAGRNWADRGTVMEGNVFRGISGWHLTTPEEVRQHDKPESRYTAGGLAHAIYLDDQLENSVIRGNLFMGIDSAAIHIGGGSYHTIYGNYFVRTREALFVSKRSSYADARARLQPFLGVDSPYQTAYPELVGREQRDPLTPTAISVVGNHFIGVPQPYEIMILGPGNAFAENYFHGTEPKVKAVFKADAAETRLNTWADWQAAGFDGDARFAPSLSDFERRAMHKIIEEAGPRPALEREPLAWHQETHP